jgi:hypothetical protein
MSEEKKIKEQPEDHRPPPTDNIEKSADDSSISSKESGTVAEENIQDLTPNIQHNEENMEVHHHGHVHEKKKWKEYLFQFLMLFLAVFCGFLAEYQLEHKIEKDREKQYIQSLIEDLATDTLNLQIVIDNFNKRIKNIDTVLALFPMLSTGYNDLLHQKLQRTIYGFPDFVKADRTMQQLKNSGGMRLIRNKKASDVITDYDLKSRDLDIDVASLGETFRQLKNIRYEIFDIETMENDLKIKTITELEAGKNNYLLKDDKPILGKFNNLIRHFKNNCQHVSKSEKILREQAIAVITILKKEYDLK